MKRAVRAGRLEQAGAHIDQQSEYGCIEEIREHAMDRAETPHWLRVERHIGRLTRCTDNRGRIKKVAVIRMIVVGKLPPGRHPFLQASVKIMRIVEREHDLNEGPRR